MRRKSGERPKAVSPYQLPEQFRFHDPPEAQCDFLSKVAV